MRKQLAIFAVATLPMVFLVGCDADAPTTPQHAPRSTQQGPVFGVGVTADGAPAGEASADGASDAVGDTTRAGGSEGRGVFIGPGG